MIRNRILLRSFAFFFLLEIVSATLFPAVSYALTAGPTSPEATSFEPVDTTDLVDFKTGDFTYSTPLLEVPGPAGSYPLALSYHAGIFPDVEASWVGLGFSLNPGSITRMVNGYPDDHYLVGNVTREFWEGEETKSFSVGASVGFANVASVSADLVFAQNTYKGFGVGGAIGAGVTVGAFTLGVSGGVGPYGQSYSSVGLSVGVGGSLYKNVQAQASVGISLNSSGEVKGTIGVGLSQKVEGKTPGQDKSMSLMDASISTGSSKPTLSISGVPSFINQQNAGRISSINKGWAVEIPIYYANLRLSRSYVRQWIDEVDNAYTYGSLYHGKAKPSYATAFDTYDLLDTELDIVDHNDAEKVLGGSFPDVDQYIVTAQGLSGSMQPYHFQQELYKQNRKNAAKEVLAKSIPLGSEASPNKKTAFRFDNDFSNRFEYEPGEFVIDGSPGFPHMSFSFDNSYLTGKSGQEGFNNNHLAGSKHVEWFTNRAILGGDPELNPQHYGFINTIAEGFIRENNDQIGGFSITNASGVTYHYALPAYSFDEVMRYQNTKKQQEESGLYFNELKKPEKYAHTWHLTAVTGPDYVDKNGNGLADSGDWGYWINYEYKRWISDYKWRNPAEGFNKDLDNDFDFYSFGKKELYCLTKISTESHVAVFKTSERFDSREVQGAILGGFESTPIYAPNPCYEDCLNGCHDDDPDCEVNCRAQCPHEIIGYQSPRPTFKLDEINLYTHGSYSAGLITDEYVLRSVKFNYDYLLCDKTPNSFDPANLSLKKGKLTLLSIDFFGKGKKSLIPPINFGYSKNPAYQKDFSDMWGYYKSDYEEDDNKNIAKLTTPVSAADVDAWSLTSIHTSLGSTINIAYESDEYNTPNLYKKNLVSIDQLQINPDNHSVILTVNPTAFDLNKIASLINQSEVELLFQKTFEAKELCFCENYKTTPGQLMGNYYEMKTISINPTSILSLQAASIEFTDNDLYDYLNSETENAYYTESICYNSNSQEINPQIRIKKPLVTSGNIVIPSNIQSFGGGLRVKELSVVNGSEQAITSFTYIGGVTTYEPVNFGKIKFDFKLWHDAEEWAAERKRIKDAKEGHNKKLYKNFSSILAVSRQLPGPGIIYNEVQVRQKTITPDGVEHMFPNYITYKFQTFNEGMIGFKNSPVVTNYPEEDPDYPPTSHDITEIKTRSIVLKDYTARIGNLQSVTTYATATNLPVLKTENLFLHSDMDGSFEQNITEFEPLLQEKLTNQGHLERSFVRARTVLYKPGDKIPYPAVRPGAFAYARTHLLGVIAKVETFPNVQVAQKTQNFKTGITSTTQNKAYDFYSGELVETITDDSYGNHYLSQAVPAYHHYPEMGMKIYDKNNKNMLTQTAEQYSFLLEEDGDPKGLLTAGIQTWDKSIPVLGTELSNERLWRKHKAYRWQGSEDLNSDGTYSYSDFDVHRFNWTNQSMNTKWEKVSEITLYDYYTHALEEENINGNFSSAKYDNANFRVIASAANSSYHEMGYSGAEDYSITPLEEGGISKGQGVQSDAHAHSGKYSLLVKPNVTGFNYVLNPEKCDLTKKYRASVWVYAPGYSETQSELNKIRLYCNVDGSESEVHPIINKSKSKSWYLLTLAIDPGGSQNVTIGVKNNSDRAVYFDDFRLHPLNSSLTSFVYDQLTGELTYILDANNFYTKFEYDEMGRLIRTTRELLNFDFGPGNETFRADAILNELKYNYGKD